jgi:hypothetical protein
MLVLNTEFMQLVKDNLNIVDNTKDLIVSDIMLEMMSYCNLSELTETMEPFARKKVKAIIDYEAENGSSVVFDVKSLKEGDTSITYNVDADHSRETVYGLSKKDKESLRKFRRLSK